MAAQTVNFILVEGETNSVCKAYSLVDGTLVGTSATLSAADTSGVEYAYVFTDLPAAEYKFVAFSSGGYALDAKFGTVALATGTYPIYYERSAERYATTQEATAISDKLGTPLGASVSADIASTRSEIDVVSMTTTAILLDTNTTIPGILGTPAGDDIATDIAAVKSDTATLLDRVTTTVATLWANLTAMITGSGASAKYTVTALENAPSGGSGVNISDEDIQEIVAGVTAVAPRICDSSAGTFRMTAGDTWVQDFTVTTTGADKFIIAVKNNAADDDTAAVLLIDSVDGLERVNGAAPDNAADASITTGAATITVTVESNITLMIVPGKYTVTVKKLDVGSDVTPIQTASLTVFAPGVSEIST
jgi:hypothetical protein